MDDSPPTRRSLPRTVLLAVAATWLLLAAFMRTPGDSVVELIGLVQRIAFGLALIAVALAGVSFRESNGVSRPRKM